MKITSLLNPEVDTRILRHRTVQAPNTNIHSEASSEYSPEPFNHRKIKTKIAKDAAKFDEGHPTGEVHYPPYQIVDEHVNDCMKKFDIYPAPDKISCYPRRIPYASDKKEFQNKTGRDGFEVFQYTFKIPNGDKSDKDWVVMWDYNIGLVRITPFFKCMSGNRKTDPKNAILASPGLIDMCHSITGGALAAQGYWLPYDAARALATTFCHSIRYPLSILFGPDFVDECIEPSDPVFKRWAIAPIIVANCATQVRSWAMGKHSVSKTPKRTLIAAGELAPAIGLSSSGLSLALPTYGQHEAGKTSEEHEYDGDYEDADVKLLTSQSRTESEGESSMSDDCEDDGHYTDDTDMHDQTSPPTTATDGFASRSTSFEPAWPEVESTLGAGPSYIAKLTLYLNRRRGATSSFVAPSNRLGSNHAALRKKRSYDSAEGSAGTENDVKKMKLGHFSAKEKMAASALLSLRYGLEG